MSSSATSLQRLAAEGPLWTSTSVVNDASSTVRMPLVRHGPCSGIIGAVVAGYRLVAPSTAET